MIAPNSLKIIINKGKKKAKFFLFFSLDQMLKMAIIAIAFYYISKLFMGELYGMMIAIGSAVFYGVLCMELQDHKSMLEHIKLAFNFYTKQTMNFLYYKEVNLAKKEEKIEHDFVEEERFKPIQKNRRRKKRKSEEK